MSKLRLTLALSNADRHQALFSGAVQVDGVDLVAYPMTVEEIFWRQAQFQDFDASEFAGAAYIILRARRANPFTAIPVFPLRAFRHSAVYVNAEAGIERPEDLKGKRIGVPEYEITIAVWVRDFLTRDYGVKPSDVEWFTGGLRHPGRRPRVEHAQPEGVRIHPPAPGKTLEGMLEQGEVDALISPRIPEALLNGSPRVRRLFPRYWEDEADYWRRTGLFPIMHTLVIRNEILEQYPWVAMNLYKAMVESKRLAIERLTDGSTYGATLPRLPAFFDQDRELMGEDFWPYGTEANRHHYGHLAKILFEQQLAEREVPYEELYAASCYSEFKV